jgi:hypothetical protein
MFGNSGLAIDDLFPIRISCVGLLIFPKNSLLTLNVKSRAALGMEPIEPEIPISSGFSWLNVIINLVSSSEIFSIWCRNPWGTNAISSLSIVKVL